MAVDFGKLNKAGLGASSFGTRKTRGASSQAAQNLANTTTATKSSLFSFKGTRMNNWVPGQHINKNMHKYNYQGMRASMNSRTFTPSYAGPAGSIGHMHGAANNIGSVTYNNDFAKGMIIGQTVAQGINLLNQLGVFGGNNGGGVSSVGSKLSSALDGLGSIGGGGSSTAIASTVGSMENAQDSASLRGALAEANGQMSALNSQTSELEAAAKTAEENKAQYKEDVKTKEKDLKEANQGVKNAQNGVDICGKAKASAQDRLQKANSSYDTAVKNHNAAKSNTASKQAAFDQAAATLSSTPEYITDAEGNKVKNDPAYSNALDAKRNAEAELNQAKSDEEAAAKAEAEAKDVKNQATQDATKAAKDLEKAEADLEKAEGKLKTAEEAKEKAEKEYKEAEQKLNSAEGDVEKFKQHQEDVADLRKAIDKHQKRLEKMEKEENSTFDKLGNKIDSSVAKNLNRANNIDTSNGMNAMEKIQAKRMEKTNNKNDKRLEERNNLSPLVRDNQYISEMLKGPASEVVNGENYYKGTTPSGQTVYYRGTQPITEEMYKAATGTNI